MVNKRAPAKSLFAMGALIAVLSACGHEPSTFEEGGNVQLNWTSWFPNAIREADAAAADRALNFRAHVPQGLGQGSVYISPLRNAVAFVYDTAAYGRVVVVESFPDQPDPGVRYASYQNQVAQTQQPEAHGYAEIDTIRGNIAALVTATDDRSRWTIQFVADGVQFTVLGPALPEQGALYLGNTI
jgi:hypothetical protein